MTSFSNVSIPLYEFDQLGGIKPNPIFHRPWDKLHSRCIEYPFAASQADGAQRLLDVGTVKADPAWLSWLEALQIEVHATDYDAPLRMFNRVCFHQADVRDLPIQEDYFDKIMAVSVIEHIGLASPQVMASELPQVDPHGDLDAVLELARVLKPGGELIMTFPFGVADELILGGEARNYTSQSIKRFNLALEPVRLDYYEYQYRDKQIICDEYGDSGAESRRVQQKLTLQPDLLLPPPVDMLPGVVTWRRVPKETTAARQKHHVDGVLCGVWRKPLDPSSAHAYSSPAARQNKKGECLFECGAREEALAAFERAIHLEPSYAPAYGNLAVLYWMKGDGEQAYNCIRRALTLDPGNRLAVLNALDIFTGLQLHDESIQACRGYLVEHGRDEELEERLAALEAKRSGA